MYTYIQALRYRILDVLAWFCRYRNETDAFRMDVVIKHIAGQEKEKGSMRGFTEFFSEWHFVRKLGQSDDHLVGSQFGLFPRICVS